VLQKLTALMACSISMSNTKWSHGSSIDIFQAIRTFIIAAILRACLSDGTLSAYVMASLNHSVLHVPTKSVMAQLDHGLPGGTVEHLAHFDIGTFPSIPQPAMQTIPMLATTTRFHFLKWLSRSNRCDLALVTLPNASDIKVLKMVISFTVYNEEITNCLIV
jgi:hypothetical protein